MHKTQQQQVVLAALKCEFKNKNTREKGGLVCVFLIRQNICMEGKLHCISGMNGPPNQMPDSSFNSQRNYSNLSVLSGLLNSRLLARVHPS